MLMHNGLDLISFAVEKYSDTIFRIAFQHTQNKSDAEDITQEVFLALMKNPLLRDENHLKAWLIRVAINKCKDLFRSSAKRKNIALEAAATKYSLDEYDIGILERVKGLPPLDRDILLLFYVEGYSAKEIGGLVGKKEAAIFTRLKRLRLKLKDWTEVETE